MNENIIELITEDGLSIPCELKDSFELDGNTYVILIEQLPEDDEDYGKNIVMRMTEEDGDLVFNAIVDKTEFDRICEYYQNLEDRDPEDDAPLENGISFSSQQNGSPSPDSVADDKERYALLITDTYKSRPWETEDLGEGMAVVNQCIGEWWKPRFIINHNTHEAFVFMDGQERLMNVTLDDIDWEAIKHLPEEALERARSLSAHFPTFIRMYKNGVAEVKWQLNPDGRYYMDSDGYGMTDDVEVNIHGYIDQHAKVVKAFR